MTNPIQSSQAAPQATKPQAVPGVPRGETLPQMASDAFVPTRAAGAKVESGRAGSDGQRPGAESPQASGVFAFVSQRVAAALTHRKDIAPSGPAAIPVAAGSGRANADLNLGFAELVARNPDLVWSTQMTPRTEQAIKAFKAGHLGASVKALDLRGLEVGEVRVELKRRGFTVQQAHVVDIHTGQPKRHPGTGRPIPMEIWTHPDGGVVRIKPEGDPLSRYRPQPHLSIAVRYPPKASASDFNNEAFKVDHTGLPLPKWAADARNPHAANSPAGMRFLDDLASRTHVDLPVGRGTALPGRS
ncbi:MAG: hypothetical protein VKS61_16690 [Candidatus Sericytochromatia bacterium]|nr:hypothetical protein [Candidatus Sericytochromatia bacterium]